MKPNLFHRSPKTTAGGAAAAPRRKNWLARHKKLVVVLLVLGIIAAVALRLLRRVPASAGAGYQYIRTTTLQKTSLQNSVTANGTVAAGSTASVTVSEAAKNYTVATVNVQVGDVVKVGDVIATLDTADLEEQIANAQQSYNDTLEDASTSYVQSVEDQTTDLAQAEQDLADAQEDYDTLGLTDYYSSMENTAGATGTNRELVEYYYGLFAEQIAGLENTVANLQIQLTQAQNDGDADRQQQVQGQLDDYNNKLTVAKAQCSIPELGLQGFDTIAQYYTQIEQLEQALDAAQQAYDNAVTNNSRNVDKAGTQLERAQRESDTLEELQATLDDCTLTATMDGTVTALNATVGSACSGTVATIQDVDELTVEITLSADDVSAVSTGMQCTIASDATGDAEITGTLTQIDPVANEQGTFGATVAVNGTDTGLLVGIQAQVEIVQNVTDDVFVVPIDAVGTAEDGSSFVYRQTGGEGVDMTFEEVPVTTGASNDYYIEISGDDLAEGDVIRASADLTEGVESADSEDAAAMADMGGMGGMGGAMPDMGSMPDRGGGGGGAPAGGPGGM